MSLIDSILKSRRRITRFAIFGNEDMTYQHISALTEITMRFGKDVTQLEIRNLQVSRDVIELLNLMPKLEKILVLQMSNPNHKIHMESTQIGLFKLKEIDIQRSSECVLNILKRLPEGVLQKVELKDLYPDTHNSDDLGSIKLLEFQHNIDIMRISARIAELISFKKMKLTSLEVYDQIKNIENIIEGQCKLKKLSVGFLKMGHLEMICNQLGSLEVLKITRTYDMSPTECAQLSELNMLRKLVIEFDGFDNAILNECLSLMKNENLFDLRLSLRYIISSLPSTTIEQLGSHLPNLKRLSLDSRLTVRTLNLILKYLPDLEDIEFLSDDHFTVKVYDSYKLSEKLSNDKLRRLYIQSNVCDFADLPLLIGSCKKLESVTIDTTIIASQAFVRNLIKHGGHLDYFHYKCGRHNFSSCFPDEITRTMVECDFKGLFSSNVVNHNGISQGHGACSWIMKK